MRFRPLTWILIGFVKAWRAAISPLYGDVCKFRPTCSEYGLEALRQHGAFKGSWLTIRRLGRCHPWSLGGYDPVPGSPRAQAYAEQQAREFAHDHLTSAAAGRSQHRGDQ
jgi:uncharacterized protein